MAKTMYRVDVDEVVVAESELELVNYLTRTSIQPVADARAFRERATRCVSVLHGKHVRTHCDEAFVADMVIAGAYMIEPRH